MSKVLELSHKFKLIIFIINYKFILFLWKSSAIWIANCAAFSVVGLKESLMNDAVKISGLGVHE